MNYICQHPGCREIVKRLQRFCHLHCEGGGAEAKFLLMASQAEDLAVYRAKLVTPAVLHASRRAALKWNNLTKQLEAKANEAS